MSSNIGRIRAVRVGNRGVLTKLTNEAEVLLKETKANKGRLQTITTLLDEKIKRVKVLDEKVLELCEVEDIATEIEESDEIISRTLDIQRDIAEGICKVSKSLDQPKISNEENLVGTNVILQDSQPLTSNSVQEQPTEISDLANQATVHNSSPVSCQVRPKLPKLVLSKFKGNVTNWTTFWDSYKTAVHENSLPLVLAGFCLVLLMTL